VKSHRAARSYAKALHDLARERGQAEPVGVELAQAVELMRGDAALAHFFARPGVSATAKRGAADEIAQRLGVGKLVRDFLGLVAAHGRAEILPEIGDVYRARVDADLNRARARVRTTVPLTDAERTALASRLGTALGGKLGSSMPLGGSAARGEPVKVALDEVVDTKLLGGFVAEIGSLIVDGSLDGQLARLRERLARG
jgi:F-type H+-transporting ATPase subunit delta